MKFQYFTILFVLALLTASCGKIFDKNCKDSKDCTFCDDKEWDDFDKDEQNGDNQDSENEDKDDESFKEIIVEELVLDESCGCYVDGVVKYLKNGKTIALVKYYNTECDGVATKVLCDNGDCESKKATCCQFVQDCSNGASHTKQ